MNASGGEEMSHQLACPKADYEPSKPANKLI
jgi:hypothetical protein